MKIFLAILSITFFIACNNVSKVEAIVSPSESSQIYAIKLADSLGYIRLFLPSRYDTNFYWTHYSDCGSPCDKIKYRFQPKSLPINKESGWMWFDLKDSIESFTISHSGYIYPFRDNPDSVNFSKMHQSRKEGMKQNPDTYKIKSDTIEKIDNHYFSIIMIDFFDSSKSEYSKKLLASTFIKNNGVEFKFELLTKQKDSLKDKFLENSMYFLRTIKISN